MNRSTQSADHDLSKLLDYRISPGANGAVGTTRLEWA